MRCDWSCALYLSDPVRRGSNQSERTHFRRNEVSWHEIRWREVRWIIWTTLLKNYVCWCILFTTSLLRPAFHDTDIDTDTDILAMILAKMSAKLSVWTSWNAALTVHRSVCLRVYSGSPVDVGITMYISSVSSISEVDMVCEVPLHSYTGQWCVTQSDPRTPCTKDSSSLSAAVV